MSRLFKRAIGVLTLGFGLFAGCVSQADLKDNPEAKKIVSAVAAMIRGLHVRQPKLDEALSKQVYRNFLLELDPQKIYFDTADIKTLSHYETELGAQILAGDLSFPDEVSALLRQKLALRLPEIEKLLEEPEDFAGEDSISSDPAKTPYAEPGQAFENHLRKVIKKQRLSMKLSNPSQTADERKKIAFLNFEREKKTLEDQSELEVMEIYLNALTKAVDPHTGYFNEVAAADLNRQMDQSLVGIGVKFRRLENGSFEISQVLEGGPASTEGKILPGDQLLAISPDGLEDGLQETTGLSEKKTMQLVRGAGKEGTPVLLKVASKGKVSEVKLTRTRIQLDDNKAVGRVVKLTSADSGKVFQVGEIYLPMFYVGSAKEVKEILLSPDFEGIDLLILDLRNNGGGHMQDSATMIGHFIDKGPIGQTTESSGRAEKKSDNKAGYVYEGPLAVAVNSASASASEFFACALQDYGRALIIGSTTSGKNSIQQVGPVTRQFSFANPDPKEGALRLTIGEFFGVKAEKPQVLPDVTLPAVGDVTVVRAVDLENALKGVPASVRKLPIVPLDRVDSTLIASLRGRSESRQKESAGFAQILKDIGAHIQAKASGVTSLNEKLRTEQKAALGGAEDPEFAAELIPLVPTKVLRQKAEGKGKTLPQFYNDEIRNIGIDYLEMVKSVRGK